MKLEETKHDYYCECWETKRTKEYESWKDFKDNEMGYDLDCNLPFRFDINPVYDENDNKIKDKFILQLHHALQRHGSEIWHCVIKNITKEDMPEIEEYLKKCKEKLMSLWKEIE